MQMKSQGAIVAFFCAWASLGVHAEQIKVFEWRDANGVVSYSQEAPPPSVKGISSRQIDITTFTSAQKLAVKAQLAGVDAAEQSDSKRVRGQVNVADQAVNLALTRLARAESALHAGRTPLPGERVESRDHSSRLRPAYFDRQKQLEDGVQAARTSLDDAYRQRDALVP